MAPTKAETFFLLAPGESLTAEQCESVRGKGYIIAVSDAVRLAPFADALVAADSKWWRKRLFVPDFKGRKFSANKNLRNIEELPVFDSFINRGSNSGVLAMYAARLLGAREIVLVGYDMHGTHFFGPHEDGLPNTTPERFATFVTYFERMAKLLKSEGIKAWNATPGSSLKVFPEAPLERWTA